MKPKHADLTGQKFGRLTVLSYAGNSWNNMALWNCRCSCGKERIARGSHLMRGEVGSCGGHRSEDAKTNIWKYQTHGHASHGNTSLSYNSWAAMMDRCRQPHHEAYARYGGRGIAVCKRWLKFENFLDDMGVRPSKEYSIEREDNNQGYCFENCRWATRKEQSRNTCQNHVLEFDGKKMCITEWAEFLGCGKTTIRERLRRGWSVERALTEAVHAC